MKGLCHTPCPANGLGPGGGGSCHNELTAARSDIFLAKRVNGGAPLHAHGLHPSDNASQFARCVVFFFALFWFLFVTTLVPVYALTEMLFPAGGLRDGARTGGHAATCGRLTSTAVRQAT